MLNAALHNQFRNGFNQTVDALGTTVTWASADGTLSEVMVCSFRSVGRDDIAIINAFGSEIRVIVMSTSTTARVPSQFDTFMVHGMVYVVQAAHEIWLNDALVGYRCYCKGK